MVVNRLDVGEIETMLETPRTVLALIKFNLEGVSVGKLYDNFLLKT
jgi:hypothetical protein